VLLSKILRNNLQKLCQLAAPKKLVRKNSDFQENFVDVKFSEFVIKFYRTQIFFLKGLSPEIHFISLSWKE
jgi:hypothetical protein